MGAFCFCFLALISSAFAIAPGYHFATGHKQTTIHFTLYKNLIVIPVRLNDTLNLRLILDTGTRSILLYGKKFGGLRNIIPGKKLNLAGWGGTSNMIQAKSSFPNRVEINAIHGDGLCAAVIDSRLLINENPSIDGVIGYEIFVRFTVEIDYKNRVIHLYDQIQDRDVSEFKAFDIEINQSKPEIKSIINTHHKKKIHLNLLVDTGSSLGLLLFSKTVDDFPRSDNSEQIGIGLNGVFHGYRLYIKSLTIGDQLLQNLSSNLVHVKEHLDPNFSVAGSLGAEFLKDYRVIFDYPTRKLFLQKT